MKLNHEKLERMFEQKNRKNMIKLLLNLVICLKDNSQADMEREQYNNKLYMLL
jgi:hypothetical protein